MKYCRMIALTLLAINVSAFAISSQQCMTDASKQTNNQSYTGKLNIGTSIWPGYDYADFSISYPSISLSCKVAGCEEEGGHYGGNMNVTNCTESASQYTITMSGTAVSNATIIIPKSSTVPAPTATITLTANGGIAPATDSNTAFTPFHY